MTRGRLAAENPVAPLDDVEVELEDAPFVEDGFQHHRDRGFLGLAPVASLSRKKQVLGQLLRNRRASGDDPAFAHILVHRQLNAVPVEAFVIDELRIFGGNHRLLEIDRNPLVGHPHVLQARLRPLGLQLGKPHRHERGFARRVVAPPPDVHGVPRLQQRDKRENREYGPQQPAA